MTLSGPEAMRSLDDALRDIRREEDDISKRLSKGADILARIRQTEAELLRQLAAIRLDPATQAELSGRISRAEAKARDMLKSHAGAVATAEEALKTADTAIARLAGERRERLAEVEARQRELDRLSRAAEEKLAGAADYLKARSEAEELRQVADEALQKTAQAEADRDNKGRPYRDDPLFLYLWERGYGTSAYKAGNLTRMLDGWVARLVDFNAMRPNFVMLNEIPLRLREHAERQKAAADAAAEALEAREDAAVDAAGGAPARQAMVAAQARIVAIDAEMVGLEDKRDDNARAQQELAQGADPAYAEAVAALAEGLSREDVKTLLAEARATRTGEDDTIVKQIDDARARAAEEEAEARDHKERLRTLASRRRELEDIQYEFKKARFDDPRSRFGEDRLVGDMLTEFLRGGITAASYWDQWRKSQDFRGGLDNFRDAPGAARPPAGGGSFQWPDTSFGGDPPRSPSLPRGGFGGGWGRLPRAGGGGGSSSGGGFSRPRTGSSGSRKSGGFKTGGGF
jgi:DNA repair exonuclease SbcCD ATPase subunit